MIDMAICTKCGTELTNDNWAPSRQQRHTHVCKKCEATYANKYYYNVPQNRKSKRLFSVNIERTLISQSLRCTSLNDNLRITNDITYHEYTDTPTENKECSSYLGVYVAEEVLSRMFKNVVRMPYGHSGYDFICNKGMKIDSKASVMHHEHNSLGRWGFETKHNTLADYFIFIAFDDRDQLMPLHIWMIPSENFKNIEKASISISTLDKWDEYRLPIDDVVKCCDTMR